MRSKVFFSSSAKFDVVVSELIKNDWSPATEYNSDVNLWWTNLKEISFDDIPSDQIVNHFKGSQHLSNKSLFVFNLESQYPHNSLLPLNWSSSFQDMGELISKVLLNSVYCCVKQFMINPEIDGSTVNIFRSTLRVLRIDSDTVSLDDVKHTAKLLDCFTFDLKVDSQRLEAALHLLEQSQPWRLQWGGTDDLWIVKPVGLSCGEQIEVVRGLEGVIVSVERLEFKCVVQKYIERPLLLRSPLSAPGSQPTRKFDIRQWILVTALDPLVVYGFSECYLRLSSREYSLSSESLRDAKVHLCNHAIQKDKTGETINEEQDSHSTVMDSPPCDTMMTQSAFNQQLVELNLPQWHGIEQPFAEFIQPKVKTACLAAVNSCRSRLKRVGRGFEWLGLDLMVVLDSQTSITTDAHDLASVLLLEVNVSPDVSLSTPVTTRLVRPAVSDLFSLILDEGALDWTPPLVRSSEATEGDAPPRSRAIESVSDDASSPRWELWYNSDNNRNCSDLQNSFPKQRRDASHSRGGNVFRGMNGAVDHKPRKLELLLGVQACLRKGDVNSDNHVEEDEDEM